MLLSCFDAVSALSFDQERSEIVGLSDFSESAFKLSSPAFWSALKSFEIVKRLETQFRNRFSELFIVARLFEDKIIIHSANL